MKNKLLIGFLILFCAGAGSLTAQIKTQPEPLVGRKQTKEFIAQQMVYPTADLEAGKSGKVVISFDVDALGNASNYMVVSTFSNEASAEALNLVKQIVWKPGTVNSTPTASKGEMEVVFSAKNYTKQQKKGEGLLLPHSDLPSIESYKIFNPNELDQQPTAYFTEQGMTFEKYISQNLVFPDQAKELEISGKVRLSFVVEKNGRASNILIEQSVGGGCDNEAIRLINSIAWNPGVKNDSIVRCRLERDITFRFGERRYFEGNSY